MNRTFLSKVTAGMLTFSIVTSAVVNAQDISTLSSDPTNITEAELNIAQGLDSDEAREDKQTIKVTNNSDASDLIEISGLKYKDKVTVYNGTGAGAKNLGSASANSKGVVTIKPSQIGESQESLWFTVTDYSTKKVGDLVEMGSLNGEIKTDKLTGGVTVENNAGASDIVTVTGLSPKDKVVVYDSADTTANKLGSATANTEGTAVVKISQLGEESGSIFVTNDTQGKAESDRYEVDFDEEDTTDELTEDSVAITNNTSSKDVVEVSDLTEGTVVTVYDAKDKKLGSATAKEDGVATVSVTLPKVGESIKITATEKNKKESSALTQTVEDSEATSEDVTQAVIDASEVESNFGNKDVISISGLTDYVGTVVKVYETADSTKVLASATINSKGEATLQVDVKNETEKVNVHLTATEKDKLESKTRNTLEIAAPAQTTKPAADHITVENKAGIKDTVTIKQEAVTFEKGTIVNIYDKEQDGKLLAKATADGKNDVVLEAEISDLENVYVTYKEVNKRESARLGVSIDDAEKSSALKDANIIVTNNTGKDTVFVHGLEEGDTITVYEDDAKTTVLGKATVAKGQSEVFFTIKSLNDKGQKIYITKANTGKLECDAVTITIAAKN